MFPKPFHDKEPESKGLIARYTLTTGKYIYLFTVQLIKL